LGQTGRGEPEERGGEKKKGTPNKKKTGWTFKGKRTVHKDRTYSWEKVGVKAQTFDAKKSGSARGKTTTVRATKTSIHGGGLRRGNKKPKKS